jgi:large subunit ribosomal protein L33
MAKKNNTKRKIVALVSELTGHRYVTRKNKMNTPDKLKLRKYDPKARKHATYTETKKSLGRNEVKPRKG